MATLRPAVWLAATKIGSEVPYAFGHFLFSKHSLIQESLDRWPVGPLMSAEALRLKILRQVLCRWLEIWFDVCLQTARRRAAAADHSPAERSQSAMKPQEKLKGLSLC